MSVSDDEHDAGASSSGEGDFAELDAIMADLQKTVEDAVEAYRGTITEAGWRFIVDYLVGGGEDQGR
jgi:hypothetical protein